MFETASVGVCGRFKFEVRKASNDQLVKETDWMDNVVLNTGLDLLAADQVYTSVAVGTGNSTPIPTQTALDAQVAASSSTVGSDVKGYVDGANPYAFYRRKVRINAGALNNVAITEVAMKNGNVLFNRALIKDEQGNPTSIVVQSDEYLDVTGEVRLYLDSKLHSGSFDLTDRNNNLIRRVNYTGRFSRANSETNANYYFADGLFTLSGHSGGISSDINGYPSGTTLFSSDNAWETHYAYVAGSCTKRHRVIVPLNNGNTAPIKSLLIRFYVFQYQIELEEPIVKTADETLTIFLNVKWGRYTGVIE